MGAITKDRLIIADALRLLLEDDQSVIVLDSSMLSPAEEAPKIDLIQSGKYGGPPRNRHERRAAKRGHP